ncbi:catechol 2,3-dioxygenase-like lactoylglutathione lyase family enzyme [Hymenobacter luteus]|uniref:Catechol 2,3-dioxygenase-like lactoylglutathione lyase family enzyme n=2 Tax=Hymenobacter TaxID=89966 RepID=A0A7W9T185_9BACT|nr:MULTISPECIES: VOC family protein [Hymenobacter]MBB4601829.1 catechol 2,3-dioxygenase-like lactoylglutathione lyase family enzyme [Hymenobacter latericoloratus]MBB6059742.1 catechol 2,3-dioxygenase-like lactoylglutathione lyase family enzyme [Hymenobacter luteus]
MPPPIRSLRPFIGAKDFAVSRSFYRTLGFTETVVSPTMSYFALQGVGFYLQDYYVPDWVGNTMLFLEVDDVEQYWQELTALDLPGQYPGVRVLPIRQEVWGKEGFVHDPSGILWHIGEFTKQ